MIASAGVIIKMPSIKCEKWIWKNRITLLEMLQVIHYYEKVDHYTIMNYQKGASAFVLLFSWKHRPNSVLNCSGLLNQLDRRCWLIAEIRNKTELERTLRASGGSVLKHLPANAGDTGSNPGLFQEIPHATGQLSPCATTIEPVL